MNLCFKCASFSIFFFLIAAIQALKRKKRFEKQLAQIDGTLSTLELQREALEGANTNTAVITNMKTAADALKAAHQNMYDATRNFCGKCISCIFFGMILNLYFIFYRDVDQVHDMMDDIAEQQDVAREISDAISNPVAFGNMPLLLSWFLSHFYARLMFDIANRIDSFI